MFRYEGTPQGVGSFLAGAFAQLTGEQVLDATDTDHPAAFLAGEATQFGLTKAISGLMAGSGSGGGGGRAAADILGSIDEAVLIILAAVVAAILLVAAVPLGILAFEVALGLLVLTAGVCLRVAHVRPWTILVRQDGQTVAAFRVTGWKASQRLLRGLREESESLPASRGPGIASGPGNGRGLQRAETSIPAPLGDETDPVRFEVHPRHVGEHVLVVRMLSRSGKRLIEFPADSLQRANELISSLQQELAASGDLASFLGGHGVPTHLVRDACKEAWPDHLEDPAPGDGPS